MLESLICVFSFLKNILYLKTGLELQKIDDSTRCISCLVVQFLISCYNQWTNTDTLLLTKVFNLLTFLSFFLKYDFICPSQLFPRHRDITSGCCICHLSLRFLMTGSWTCFSLDDLDSFEVCWPGTLWSVFIMKFIVIIIIFIIILDLLGLGIEVLFLSQYVKYTSSMIFGRPHDFDNCTNLSQGMLTVK